MKKGFFCLIITLCLFGCQINPTTEEILRTQIKQFQELTDTFPIMGRFWQKIGLLSCRIIFRR